MAIDLFAGLFGFSAGCLEAGWRVVGFDIERKGPVPKGAELVIQDVSTLAGWQLKDADLIVASPPCTEYSYMAQPWKRAKHIAGALRGECPFPDGYKGSRTVEELTALFDACFRIQREAIAATGHSRTCPECDGDAMTRGCCRCERCDGKGHIWVGTRYIPMVVENVRGAEPWVGKAKAHFGSFYLWGDVESIGGAIVPSGRVEFGMERIRAGARTAKCSVDLNWNRKDGKPSLGFNTSTDAIVHGRKVPGFNFHEHEKTGQPGRSFQSAAVEGHKNSGGSWFNIGTPGQTETGRNPVNGVKQGGNWWHDPESMTRKFSSRSSARKQASAEIARIPFALSSWVARCFKP